MIEDVKVCLSLWDELKSKEDVLYSQITGKKKSILCLTPKLHRPCEHFQRPSNMKHAITDWKEMNKDISVESGRREVLLYRCWHSLSI